MPSGFRCGCLGDAVNAGEPVKDVVRGENFVLEVDSKVFVTGALGCFDIATVLEAVNVCPEVEVGTVAVVDGR